MRPFGSLRSLRQANNKPRAETLSVAKKLNLTTVHTGQTDKSMAVCRAAYELRLL
jgi:hypothetical protein